MMGITQPCPKSPKYPWTWAWAWSPRAASEEWGAASGTSSPTCRRGNIPESRSVEEAMLWGPECCIKSSADEAVITSYFSNVGICVLQNREKNAIQVESMWGLKVGMILILSSFRSVHTFSFNHAVL